MNPSFPGMEVPKTQILLSLQPQYWRSIAGGEKNYEYRRNFRSDAVLAYIYASYPTQAIVGLVEFEEPIVGSVETIVMIGERDAAGSSVALRRYFSGLARAYAIKIASYEQFAPITLTELQSRFPCFTPPQSYIVLDNHPQLLKFLRTRRQHTFVISERG